jgi:hypothetical protein
MVVLSHVLDLGWNVRQIATSLREERPVRVPRLAGDLPRLQELPQRPPRQSRNRRDIALLKPSKSRRTDGVRVSLMRAIVAGLTGGASRETASISPTAVTPPFRAPDRACHDSAYWRPESRPEKQS